MSQKRTYFQLSKSMRVSKGYALVIKRSKPEKVWIKCDQGDTYWHVIIEQIIITNENYCKSIKTFWKDTRRVVVVLRTLCRVLRSYSVIVRLVPGSLKLALVLYRVLHLPNWRHLAVAIKLIHTSPTFHNPLLIFLSPHPKKYFTTIYNHLPFTPYKNTCDRDLFFSHRTITLKEIETSKHPYTLPTQNDVQSCIAHIPCASRALLPHRRSKILLHLHQRLSRGDSLEKQVLVCSFFSISRVSFSKCPQIPAAGCLQPFERAFFPTRRLSGIPVLFKIL